MFQDLVRWVLDGSFFQSKYDTLHRLESKIVALG